MVRLFRHSAVFYLLVSLVILVPAGCKYRQTTNCPTPAASGLNTRDLIDTAAQAEAEQLTGIDRFLTASDAYGARIRGELQKNAPADRPQRNVLCLSGGGSYGAFSAGIMIGWTARGDRPTFDVVTGISTGSLVAPFAFLGSKYDAELQRFYTTVTNDDIFKRQLVKGLLGRADAFTDTAPLRRQIASVISPELIADLAEAHRAGRRLIVGTTEEEGMRFIIWDLGAMACRNGPGDRDLMIDVLLASAAIPGVFPAVKIDVEVDGVCHTERHVDGGISQGVFFYPPYVPPEQRTAKGLNMVGTNVYAVIAGKLYLDAAVVKSNAFASAGKAVSGLIAAQTRGDLQRLWTYCLINGMNYHFTAVPAEYSELGSAGEFEPKVMQALFAEGRRLICSGGAWRSKVPMTDVASGEFSQARSGRCLTFQPHGPQLTILGPRGIKVPPKYPGVGTLGSTVPE